MTFGLIFKQELTTSLVSSIGCTHSRASSCQGLVFVMIVLASYTESGILVFREWKLVQIVADNQQQGGFLTALWSHSSS